MKGGYQIIDLTNIDIVLGSEAVTITDNQVLTELLTLRDYIEDDYDYSKPLNRKLKPILLRLRDEKEGEEIEASLWANLSIIDDNLSFKIEGIINGKTITINTVFEKLQDDDGNDYYAIDEATYLLTNQQPIFENIIDKDGHSRFIEGDIDFYAEIEGVSKKYGKWSLSGTHLLIVLCVEIDANTNLPFTGYFAKLTNLPTWLFEKIIPLVSTYIDRKNNSAFNEGASIANVDTYLRKSVTEIFISVGSYAPTDDRVLRIVFDLLIDNE